jgi:hypothetical protein
MHRKALLSFIILLLFLNVSCKQNNTSSIDENITIEKKPEIAVQGENITPEVKDESIIESIDKDFILVESSTKKITEEEIFQLDSSKLDYARNEIYARKGYVFQNEKYRGYFLKKAWYKPSAEVSADNLSDIEKYNVNFLKFYEEYWSNNGAYTQNQQKQLYDAYKASEKALIDLNGDEKKEEIIYKNLHNAGYKLSANGSSVEDDKYTDLADFFAVVDIDKSDKYLEILISDYGPSSDDYSTFYFFNNNKLIKMGETAGVIEYNEIKIDGSGNFSARTRGQILQTWYFDKHYKLTSEHKLIEIPQDIYLTDYDVFVKSQIKLYTERNETGDYFDLLEGQIVKIVGTDDKEWCLIETSAGKKGWFALEHFNQIRNEGLDAGSVFAGLSNAD